MPVYFFPTANFRSSYALVGKIVCECPANNNYEENTTNGDVQTTSN